MTANVVHPAELERTLQARVEAARKRRSTSQRPRSRQSSRRWRRRATLPLTVLTLLALSAVAVFADAGSLNVEVADKTGYAVDTTDDGAIVEYIGDDNVTFGSSGSGIFDSFLRVQADDDEAGYNTDGDLEFDTKTGSFTHAILVSDIPVLDCESVDGSTTTPGLCWELFADLNESNSTPKISLDELEIYFTDDPELTGYPFAGTADQVYDFLGEIRINDVNQGSGRGDLRYSVPLDGITIPENCDYGNAACETYFVLYTVHGNLDGDFDSDGGFEEWKVKRYPFLTVEKTAATTFTRTFEWTIDKSVDPDTWDLFDGDTGTSDYTVDLTKDDGTDSDWAVSGTITIENPSEQDAVIDSVADVVSGAGAANVLCGVTFPHELDSGDSLNCTYSLDLPDGSDRTNTATATLSDGPVFTGEADVTFGDPTTLVDDTVNVTDSVEGDLGEFSDDDSVTYSRTFECGDDEGTHDNTATIVETGQDASASVTVTCYDLTVTKTAVPTFSRDFDWTITKTVDPTSLDLFDGDSADVEWTVTWTKGAAEDFGYAVSGTITIANNHPTLDADLTQVVDSISGVGDADTLNCPSLTVPAADSIDCTYSSDLPDDATRTNTATATQQNYDYASDLTATPSGTTDYSGNASIDFTGVNPTVTDDTATITDDRGPLNQLESSSGSTSYTETFECGEDEGTHTNTAVVTETDSGDTDDDDASVTVNCYELTVTKDAATSFDRDYDWEIAKTRVLASGEVDGDLDLTTLTLDPDQTYTLTYEITVDLADTPFVDANWAVAGTITVANPAPIAADDVVVTDVISGYGDADFLDCDPVTDGEQTTVDIAANSSVDCAYSSALPDATDRTNTATATLFGIGYEGTADVDFSTADITEIDECITVVDDNGTPANLLDDVTLGTVCADDTLPHTFTHTIDVGPFEVCGEFVFTNTASFTTVDDENDTDESGSDDYTVIITVPCPQGCTLTLGYWKTHNASFWGGAPDDPNWFLIGDVDGDGVSEGQNELFFDTGDTWFEVFWTNVAGRPYYQLAHQWMAAYLNALSIQDLGGTIPSEVQDALDDGAALLDEYDGSEAGKTPDLKGKGAKDIRAEFVELAGILGSFNEGDIGPGHCDEDGSSDDTAGQLLIADHRARLSIG